MPKTSRMQLIQAQDDEENTRTARFTGVVDDLGIFKSEATIHHKQPAVSGKSPVAPIVDTTSVIPRDSTLALEADVRITVGLQPSTLPSTQSASSGPTILLTSHISIMTSSTHQVSPPIGKSRL